MKILYLSAGGGGLDTSIRVLASALAQAGHQVSVLYYHFPGESTADVLGQIHGFRVYHTRIGNLHYYAHRLTFGRTALAFAVQSLESAWAFGGVMQGIQEREGLDLVEVPEGFTTPRLMRGIPYFVRLHSAAWTWRSMLREPVRASDSLSVRMEAYALRRARGISSPSHFLAKYIKETCKVDRSIEILPYPVDIQRFAPPAMRASPPVVLFVGRVEARKGAAVLMQAIPSILAEQPDSRFVFAGRVCDDVREQISTMPASVQFLGVRPHDELAAWYQRASVFVAPSLWDNSPNTVYEAMACGVPVVSTRAGGIPELVDHGATGLLVPPGDPKALADAVVSLLADPVRRQGMGARAREKAVSCYAVGNVLEKTLTFYQRELQQS